MRAIVCFLLVVLSLNAVAYGVLDTNTTNAISAGFTDLKDTIIDLLAAAFMLLIGIAAIFVAVGAVRNLIHLIAGK